MHSIEVDKLTFRRKEGFQLGPLSLSLEPAEKVALLGPSGCGKTTFLRLLAGLEPADSGSICFGDRLVTEGRRLTPPSERRIGFVFQDGALWPHLTAIEQLRFADPKLSRSGALELLERVGLKPHANRRPQKLSGGEQQRLALARALVGAPALLMLDEPLHSVDVHLRDDLSLLIRRLADERGLGLIVVTHDREEALAMADRLVILRAGRIVEQAPASELLSHPKTAFSASFLCRAVCFEATPVTTGEPAGCFQTIFGALPGPNGRATRPLVLALLPGDLRLAVAEGAHTAQGRVLQVAPGENGLMATVELEGRSVRVPCPPDLPPLSPGSAIALELSGAPRFLDPDEDRTEAGE